MNITNGGKGLVVGVRASDRPRIPNAHVTVPSHRREHQAGSSSAAEGKCRIFIVDDHVLIRHGVATLISGEADMEVCGQAEDSAAALEGIIKLQPDIVIVDISLKGNSGIELIKNIRAHSPKIQILVLSMHHESVYALRALKAGARGYVMKQDVINKVVEGIRRLRRGHLCVSDEIAGQMLNRFMGGAAVEETSLVDSLSDRELEIVNLLNRAE